MLAPISGTRRDGRSSFRALKEYLVRQRDPDTGELVSRGVVVLSPNLLSEETLQAEMRAVANENPRVEDPVYHYQLCWQPGEQPTWAQWQSAAEKSLSALGFSEHQYLIVAHADREHFHVHVMVNRVHPETYRAHYPEFSKRSLDRALREIEAEQGWKPSPGLYRWEPQLGRAIPVSREERERTRALEGGAQHQTNRLEHFSDTESLEAYAKGQPARALRELMKNPYTRWEHVHATLQQHGLEIEPGEKGGYVVRAIDSDLRVKASAVFRDTFSGKANRARLAEKLGAYEPAEPFVRVREPEVSYQPRPRRRDSDERADRREERARARADLRERYAEYARQARAQSKAVWVRGQEEQKQLSAAYRLQKQRVRELGLSAPERQAMRSVLAAEAVRERERLRQRIRREQAETKPLSYRVWVEERAIEGDQAAISQLRGFRYAEKRRGRSFERDDELGIRIEPGEHGVYDPITEAIAGMTWEVNRRSGEVLYKVQGRTALRDRGPVIDLLDRSEETYVVGLKLALQKYGPKIQVFGSDAERKAIAFAAAKNGLQIEFSDQQMRDWFTIEKRFGERAKEHDRERQHGRGSAR